MSEARAALGALAPTWLKGMGMDRLDGENGEETDGFDGSAEL